VDGFESLESTGLPLVDLKLTERVQCTFSGCGYSHRDYYTMETNERYSGNGRGWKLRSTCSGCVEANDEHLEDFSVSPDGDDIRFILMDNDSEYDLFTAAGVPLSYISSDTAYQWYMSFRSEILWMRNGLAADQPEGVSCPTRTRVVDNEDEIKTVVTAQLFLLLSTCGTFFLITCYYGYNNLQNKYEGDEETIGQWTKIKWFFKILGYAMMILSCILALALVGLFLSITSSDVACTDDLSSETFISLGSIIGGLSYSNYINGASQSLDVILDVASSFFK
jgi:hypothetical protein